MSKRKTTKICVEEFRVIHGDTYDYSKFIYVNAKTKGIIICKKHGEFLQTPDKHKSGNGCKHCGRERTEASKYTSTEDYRKKFLEVHGTLYNYLDDEFISDKKTRIECKEHGIFLQTPVQHASGRGCKKCGYEKAAEGIALGRSLIIEKAIKTHGDTFDYSRMMCDRITDEGKIGCSKHGYFKQYMVSHIKGSGCPQCGKEKSDMAKHDDLYSFTTKVERVHGDNLDFSEFRYEGCQVPGKVFCKKHEYEFYNTPNAITQGVGCPKCSNTISKGEGQVEEYLKQFTEVKKRNRSILEDGKEIDIYLPYYNIGIEYNGLYWHSDLFKDNNYHLTKTELGESRDFHIIHIFEDEWLEKRSIIESRLKNLIGKSSRRIYARKCEIKEVTSKDARKFLEENHLQGNINSSIRIGLYYKEELISVATFGKLRKSMGSTSKEGVYEMYRFCNKLDTNVVGGASKLFSFFIKNYPANEVVSYADRRWSKGNLYENLGFTLDSKTRPNYFYTKGLVRENRFSYRKDVLVKEGFDPNKTEKQIMEERGYSRIYDCGTLKYSYKIN